MEGADDPNQKAGPVSADVALTGAAVVGDEEDGEGLF